MSETLQRHVLYLILSIPAFVMAMTLHEFAHAWTADRLGDNTPRGLGRVTLDPAAHLDPVGTIMFVISYLAGMGIGWAKPVPFDPRNLKDPRRDSVLIALAGPVSNLLQFLVWLAALWVFSTVTRHYEDAMSNNVYSTLSLARGMLIEGVALNLLLAAFNMIPLPPLDGHYILQGLGPPAIEEFYRTIRPFAPFLFIMLVMMPNGPLDRLLMPVDNLAVQAISIATGAYSP